MRIVMHHASHDLPILAEMFGMPVEDFIRSIQIEDTMVQAYVLRLLPQGLKPLEERFNGRKRAGYMDIIREADHAIAVGYLRKLLTEYVCIWCHGDGESVEVRVGKRRLPLAPKLVTCMYCEGDGTSLPSPDEHMEFTNGKVRMARGHRIGSRVRRVLEKARTAAAASELDSDEDNDNDGDGDSAETVGLRHWWMGKGLTDYREKIEQVAGAMPETSLDDVQPQSVAVEYSAADADGTLRLYGQLDEQLRAEGLQQIYEINRDTLPMLTVMMEHGTYVDVPYLRKLDARLEADCDRIMYQLEQQVGRRINPNSSKQVAELLFDQYQLPIVAETKGGDASTQDKVLGDLRIQVAERENSAENDEILQTLDFITDYRERNKLRGTYTIALPRAVDKNGRIHTTFKSTRTETNRLSSAKPNLQNIPARSELGKLVRGAFCAPPGMVLVAVDYSQIEVRVIAHASQDGRLIDSIRAGADVHAITASTIFRVPLDKVQKWQRALSKRITFLILYGGGALKLKAELKLDGINITEAEAQQYIDAYLIDAYPGISDFMDAQISYAKRHGYVEDLFGWRRYLPGVHSKLTGVRMEAERMCVNAPIQSGAAGIMRLACRVLFDEMLPKVRKAGYPTMPLLTVHDEFVLETVAGGEQLVLAEVISAMTGVMKLDVPIGADGKFGLRWNELK